MDKFLIKRKRGNEPTYSEPEVQSSRNAMPSDVQARSSQPEIPSSLHAEPSNVQARSSQPEVSPSLHVGSNEEINLDELQSDPALRMNIYDFHPSQIEKVRRAYLQRGPFQPRNHTFPQTQIDKLKRRFNPKWFDEYGRWLEYSITNDAAYCLCCYLFKHKYSNKGGGESFVSQGFRNWKKKEILNEHIRGPNSSHFLCLKACDDLMNHKQHIEVCLSNNSEQARLDYRVRLTATFDSLKFLLRQGLGFRGHDESEGSSNRGNFLELLDLIAEQNPNGQQVILKLAPQNHKMTSPDIQKDIINAAASVTTKAIMQEIGDGLFSLLVDESRDISVKEQMAVVLRYVDKRGCVVERFIGIVHVRDTSALSLKAAIDSFFSKHGLSMSNLRGQGYDGASNMRGEFNGLKTLILKDNPYAFYVHCFAHQLQLTLVAVAKKNKRLCLFFDHVGILSNIVGASCKCRDLLREKQFEAIIKGIYSGERETGRGLNQETTLKRPGDTRWGSHFYTLCSLIDSFSSVIDVLEVIEDEGSLDGQRAQAQDLKLRLQTFEFVFILYMMKIILGITNELSQALQRKDQDIINAMTYVQVSKRRLQRLRDEGWESLFDTVSSFCTKNEISIPNLDDLFVVHGRSRRNVEAITNLHYYRVELFYAAIDLQLQELNNRFNEINTELLLCMACLDPSKSFTAFNLRKLLRFAKFYPSDFSSPDIILLEEQLQNYIEDVRYNDDFFGLNGIGELAQKLVETKKHMSYPMVYLLIKLALLLPVATASVERAFSAMKIIKSTLRNRMGDELMNDCLVTYIEHEVFNNIDKEEVLQHFQNMKNRRMLL